MESSIYMTREDVLKYLDYLPKTGSFVWKFREEGPACWNGRWVGKPAGSAVRLNNSDIYYVAIRITKSNYKVHQLVWLVETNTWCDYIDHADGNGLNNRFYNLREATRSQNLANSHKLQRGVYVENGKFRAMIRVEGNLIHLGTYLNREEAQAVYNIAADKFFGSFARINRPMERRF